MDATPTEIPVQDDQITPSTGAGSAPTSTSTSSTGPSLPHGWEGSKAGDDMTGIILGLSLSLALSLIAFMIGIVWWRRKRRKQETDAEKPPSTIDTASTQLSEEAQRVLSKQRKWQRASAKWLAGVKHSARRRRRFGATASTRPSDTDLLTGMATAIQASTSGVSLTRTQTTTNHDSAYTTPSASVRRVPPRSRSLSIASSDGNANHSSGANPLSPLSPHPPAYMPDPADNSRSHRQTYLATSPDSRPSEVRPSVDLSADPSSPCPYEPPIHSAHVATDDKAILAQMARMASAPPPGDEPSPVHPSVPILEVDSFEALPPEHGTRAASASFVTHDTFCSAKQVAPSSYPSRHVAADHDMDLEVPSYAEAALRHRSPVLPLPPEKVPLTGPTFYEYPNEFEDDVASTDPPPGPSSPPFEELSAPPFAFEDGPDGAHMMVPSAPPVEVEDEPTHIGEFLPSAPPFDVNDSLPTIDPHSPPVSPDLESSTPMTGDHRHVNVDARPGAVSSGRGAEYGSSASPPQYLP
ncbi:hypothetical protein LXA43DRAFT_971623 [Ganoderma leucocontextum]|nr:hypothetical protein LXA43DRAFT_971623 [Ganoderma leucocontextum]